jgi:hypothetical protein
MKAHNAGGRIPRLLDKIQEEVNTQLHAQLLHLGEESSIPFEWAAEKAPETFSGRQKRETCDVE